MQSPNQSRTSVAFANGYRVWLGGAAICLFLILLIAPKTGGLVRLQVRQILGVTPNLNSLHVDYAKITADHPVDYQIQLAAASSSFSSDNYTNHGKPDITQLAELEARFPDRPSTYANILRILCIQGRLYDRPEDYIGSTKPQSIDDKAPDTFPYAFYDQTALVGEKVDPDNAFFPFLRASGFYRQYKDKAAMEEVHNASLKHSWRDYISDNAYGSWKISNIQLGSTTAFMLITSQSFLTYPHYGRLREATRVEAYKTMSAQKSGDASHAISIREDMIRCGSLMRSQSTSLIGSLVGIAIAKMGYSIPRDKSASATSTSKNWKVEDKIRLSAFCAYLQKNGRGDLVKPVMLENSADNFIIESGITKKIDPFGEAASLVKLWTFDFVVLSNCFLLLILGVIASVVVRIFRLDIPKPISKGYRLTIVVGVILGIALCVLYGNDSVAFEWTGPTVVAITVAVILVSALVQRKSFNLKRVGQNFSMAVGIAVGVGCLIELCNRLTSGCFSMAGIFIADIYYVPSHWASTSLLFSAIVFAPILLLCFVSLLVSLVRRVPVLNGMLIGIAKASIPLAFVLVIVYSVAMVKTIALERVTISHGQQQLANEGQYCSMQTGLPWPGPVKWPAEPSSMTTRNL